MVVHKSQTESDLEIQRCSKKIMGQSQRKIFLILLAILSVATETLSSTAASAPSKNPFTVSTRQFSVAKKSSQDKADDASKKKKPRRPSWREGRVPKSSSSERTGESSKKSSLWSTLSRKSPKDPSGDKKSSSPNRDPQEEMAAPSSLFSRRRKLRQERREAKSEGGRKETSQVKEEDDEVEEDKASPDNDQRNERTATDDEEDHQFSDDSSRSSHDSAKQATNTTSTTTATDSDKEKTNSTSTENTKKRPSSYRLVLATRDNAQPVQGAPYGAYPPHVQPSNPHRSTPGNARTAYAISQGLGLLLVSLSRIWLPYLLLKKLLLHEETIEPSQHFVWEVLNDKYVRDERALSNVLSKSPAGISNRLWKRHLKHLRPSRRTKLSLPQRTVVVVNITPNHELDLPYLSEVVTFLLSQHANGAFGVDPEIVMLLYSPGGEVTMYGKAASELGRLYNAGIDTTVCVDRIAASGGYMMASQAKKILAAPFAMIGSIGVMVGLLNGNDALNKLGIKPVVLKAGENKNRLNQYGKISSADLAATQKEMARTHEQFIELCMTKRPELDRSVCDGTVLSGIDALNTGMIDEIKTSDEYIQEKINAGDHVLKMHKSVYGRVRLSPFSFLSLIPASLKTKLPEEKFQAFLATHLNKERIGALLSEGLKYTALLRLIVQTLGKQGSF